MGDLTKNFSRWEFACKCGCGFDDIDLQLVEILQEQRDWWRRPIRISSGCRCVEHNRAVGGAENGQHPLGKAADFAVKRIPAYEVAAHLEKTYPDQFGIGRYESFTHLDVREGKARW